MAYTLKTPDEYVRDAIKLLPDPERVTTAFQLVPGLQSMAENLARMVLDVVPTRDDKEPLLCACLKDAWASYCETDRQSAPVPARVAAFAKGITKRLDEINEVRVYVQRGQHPVAWGPSPETLYDFLSRHGGAAPLLAREKYAKIDAVSCRKMIAARVLDFTQINALGGSLDEIVFEGAV